MSKTLFVHFRNDGFWAYDVGTGIFLKHLVDAADTYCRREDADWLRECIERWRFNAVVSDCGLHLDEVWAEDQIRVVRSLIEDACRSLEHRDFISAEEMAAWDLLDGRGVFARGDPQFPTAPVIELGRAIAELLLGTLPAAPKGSWWFYGVSSGRSTLRRGDRPADRPPGQIDGAHVVFFSPVERHRATPECTQLVCGASIGPAANLAICESPSNDAFYLFYCDPEWNVLAAGRYETPEAAFDQAEFEYTVLDTWEAY